MEANNESQDNFRKGKHQEAIAVNLEIQLVEHDNTIDFRGMVFASKLEGKAIYQEGINAASGNPNVEILVQVIDGNTTRIKVKAHNVQVQFLSSTSNSNSEDLDDFFKVDPDNHTNDVLCSYIRGGEADEFNISERIVPLVSSPSDSNPDRKRLVGDENDASTANKNNETGSDTDMGSEYSSS